MSTVIPTMQQQVTPHPTRSAPARQLALSLRAPWPFVPFSDAGELPPSVAPTASRDVVEASPVGADAAQLVLPLP